MADQAQSWREMSAGARAFITAIAFGGAAVLVYGGAHWSSATPAKFVFYLAVALLVSRLKVDLPGITGTMSVNFLFILLGVLELSLAETLALGCSAVLVQCLSPKGLRPVHAAFNIGETALAIFAAYSVYHITAAHVQVPSRSLLLVAAASTYFVANTAPIAAIIALTENKSVRSIWANCYFWSFPYYLVGAAIAGLVSWLNRLVDWQTSLLVLPAVFLIYRSYRLYLGKLEEEKRRVEDEKRHVEEMTNLHLRTIEALALAIEAKDHTTHDHLQRVRIYAVELAKELKISPAEMEALEAAALLHDIGKLAVPENIISKPGRLTQAEFEKMKIHPLVGAEILERVHFPYPVVPIVRAHHEKWDGSGYPLGLKGEEIPIGARILSAVDFLDALASDRQYRRAMGLEEVMTRLRAESGISFDPRVVDVLLQRSEELEKRVREHSWPSTWTKLSTDVKVRHGGAPATGFEQKLTSTQGATFLASIAAARQEAQTLFELSQDLGASLSLDETLSVFSIKLRRLVPYDAIAIFVQRDNELVPEYVNGDNFRMLGSLRIPLGQGISGWVAQNRKPLINGHPSAEPGYVEDIGRSSSLLSALAIPLEGVEGVVGVLTLYKAQKDFFTSDHLRILLAISSKMSLAIENAIKYRQAENSATTDYLTGLPNARSLFLQLDRELARCKRDKSSLFVMVCDMDGFKQINDRFGHLEGNRVLEIFARTLKETCREYDYVARMGGDEFVMVAPGLTPEAARTKALHLRDLAVRAGREVCGEEILSLSIGQAVYPSDGLDAEELLAEADRRMYVEKQSQAKGRNRRLHPRLHARPPVDLLLLESQTSIAGRLTDISVGGCFVETDQLPLLDSGLKLALTTEDGRLEVEGTVVRTEPGIGIAIRFADQDRNRRQVLRALRFIESTLAKDQSQYASNALPS